MSAELAEIESEIDERFESRAGTNDRERMLELGARSPEAGNRPTPIRPGEKEFAIALDFFAGPMDLLLHLVHQQEVQIEQVSMRVIAEQYLQVISRAKLLDLEKASEYLVIAATLMSIKSAALLPSAPLEEGEPNPDETSEAFYEELRARLKAYELTKARAKALVDLPQLGVNVFTRNDRKALLPTPEMLAEPEEAHALAGLFARLVKRVGGAATYRIRLESISVVSYMMKVVDTLGAVKHRGGPFAFSALLKGFARRGGRKDAATSESPLRPTDGPRGVVIGSFIAVLELMKRGLLRASQSAESEDIELQLALAYGEQTGAFESEFDAPEENASTMNETVTAQTLSNNGGAELDGKVIPLSKYQRTESQHEASRLDTGEDAGEDEEVEQQLKEANTRGDR